MTCFLASADEPQIYTFITLVLFSVVAVSLILSKFKQSLMGGYFLCGVILSNCGLIDMSGATAVSIGSLSEIGVILLMFTIGIQFSLDELKHLRKFCLIGGGIQMGLCSLVFGLCMYWAGLSLNTSMVLGIIVGLSSTAVALKSFQELNQTGTSAAKLALGIALFQDILAILLMATMPQLLATGQGAGEAVIGVLSALGKGAFFLVSASLFGKFVLPRLMEAVAHTRSPELFTVSVLALCACIAMTGSQMGLNLALGAFAAGMVVSGSYYSHRVLSEIMPFRDLFLTLFFVSAGLHVNLSVIVANLQWVLLGLAAIFCIKLFAALAAGVKMKLSGSMALLSATALSNVGEFSLVLLTTLDMISPLPHDLLQCLYAIVAVSMGVTPALVRVSLKWGKKLDRLPLFSRKLDVRESHPMVDKISLLKDHAIICGFGPVGQRLYKSLSSYAIPCIIVDLNADTIRGLLRNGTPALLGDIRHNETLKLVGVDRAQFIAFTFPDINPVLAARPEIQSLNPLITIAARAKYPSEVERLWNAGVRSIAHDEAEVGTAMEHVALSSFHLSGHVPEIQEGMPSASV